MRRRSRSLSQSRSRSRSRSRSPRSEVEGTRVHVGDLSVNVAKQDLEQAFGQYGRLEEVWMARTPPCFAFVVFRNQDDAEEAVRNLNGQIVGGSCVRVSLALPRVREQRRRSTFDTSMKCYQCGERGHFARDCYAVGRNRNRWSPRRRSRSPRQRQRSRSGSRSRSRSRSHDRQKRSKLADDKDSKAKQCADDWPSEKHSRDKLSNGRRSNDKRSEERMEKASAAHESGAEGAAAESS